MAKDKADIWMPLYIGDYLADTSHLEAAQHGCYLLWLMHYWRKGPLPNDLAVLVIVGKLRGVDAPSIAQALLVEFFKLGDDGRWHQKRTDAEIEVWQDKHLKAKEKARRAANSRWNTYAPSIASSNAQALLVQCPLPSPLPLPKKQKKQPAPAVQDDLPPFVDQGAWDAFAEMRKKKRCPMTPRARELILAQLEKLQVAGDDPNDVLNQSTMNGYQGVFPLKGGSNGANRKYLEQQAALDEGFRQFDQRYAAQNANGGVEGVLPVADATPGYRP